jgi:ribosomal protein L34E
MGAAGAGDKAEGVPEGWTDTLERVPKEKLGEGMCAICNERFLDGISWGRPRWMRSGTD